MSVLSLFVASVFILSAFLLAVPAAGGVTRTAAGDSGDSCVSNGFLTAQVDGSTGKYGFDVGSCATAGDVANYILYGGLWSSFTTVADFTTGVDYTESGSGGGTSLGTPTSSGAVGSSIITVFPSTAEGLVVTQNVTVTGSTFSDSAILMNVKVVNTKAIPQEVGIRYLWDAQVGGYDGTWLREYDGTTAGAITGHETTYTPPPATFTSYAMGGCSQGSVVPPPYTCNSSNFGAGSGAFSVFGSMSSGPGATTPARFVYGWWRAMFGTAYGYVPDPSNEVGSYVPNDGGTQDSAMLYYFSNETLPGTGGILSNQADISGSSSAMRSATYTTVSCNPKSAVAGSSTVITCWADPDRLSGSVQPTGTVRWSQAGTGSVSFKSTACTLMHGSDAVCFVVVVGAVNGHVIITATYMGDSSDKGSSGTAKLTITKASTHTTLSCAKSSFGVGTKITCTAAVSGGYPSHTGTVTWSKVSGTGKVTFSSKTCTLSSGKCSVTITATAAGSVKIEATYGGDSHNLRSSGTFVLTMA